MTTEETVVAAPPAQLPVAQRAALALGTDERSTALAELAKRSAAIVTITNADGYRECHAARMALKRERVEIERLGKTAREDATAFAKAVIAEQARLVSIIHLEELRLQALQEAEDDRVAAEKKKLLDAERDRIAAINKRLDWIRNRALDLVGKPTAALAEAIAKMEALPIDVEHYAEFTTDALAAGGLALERLRTMHAASLAADEQRATLAEQQRLLTEKQAQLDADDAARTARIFKEDAERQFAADYDDAMREDQERIRAARQRAEDDERQFANDFDDATREDRQRTEDATRKFLQSWDDAIREDAWYAELARLAAKAADDERIAKDTAAGRARQRADVEPKADPWAALYRIYDLAGRGISPPRVFDELLEALSDIQTEVDAVQQYRAELEALDKAAA